MNIWIVILSSTVISGLISAIISGWFNLRSKNTEYSNAYFKMILERRLAAYEDVDQLIRSIKAAVVDSDQRPYHLLFSKDDDQIYVYQKISEAMSKSLWLSEDVFAALREFNVLVAEGATKELGLIEFGKQKYKVIAELRTKLERICALDMIKLHDVPNFLKNKKYLDSYSAVSVRD